MKKSKKTKFFVIALVFITFFMCFAKIVNANETIADYDDGSYTKTNSQFQQNFREVQDAYASSMTGGTINYQYTFDVTKQMVEEKTAVRLTKQGAEDDLFNAADVSLLTGITDIYKDTESKSIKQVLTNLEDTLGYKKSDIEIRATIYKPGDNNNKKVFSTKTSEKEDWKPILDEIRTELEKEFLSKYPDVTAEMVKEAIKNTSDKNLYEAYLIRRLVRIDAIMPDGNEYTLVLAGKNYNHFNWYMVRTKQGEFKTDITYTAVVDGNNVDGTKVDETFFPNYDRSKVEKDANVTANIVSTTKNDIVKINGVDLNPDGTKNELGWYYSNKEDKTVISKDYPFDTFDNIVDDGIVVEKDLELTSSDGLKDKETVSIEWPFRITDLKQDPEEITEDTKKVTFIITTNLPMEEEKLPEGWAFTTDEEGKTQHRIYKEFFKENGDKKEDVIVTANDRDDTDSTQVEVKWPAKPQAPEKLPDTGSSYVLIGVIVALVGCSAIIYRKIRK